MNMQLAKEVPLAKLKFPLFAEIKYDGVRAWIIRANNYVLVKTRNNKTIHLRYTQDFLELPEGVYDCEITLASGKVQDRTKVSGMINSAIHHGDIDEALLMFNCFDYLALDDAWANKCNTPHSVRRTQLQLNLEAASDRFNLAVAMPVESIPQLQQVYAIMLEKGYEGLILKHADSPYEFKRSKHWVKMKETKTADLKCVGIVPGQGKYDGMIGSLICQGLVEGVLVEVNVGSGMTDADRAGLHIYYTGKTIEVKYNTVIQDRLGSTHSLFLPRFVAVRFDK